MGDTVTDNAVALVFEDSPPDGDSLKSIVRDSLKSNGLCPWNGFDADIFTYKGRTLVLARPVPPLLARPSLSRARLRRSK